jgi:hypothetical protein
MSNIHAVVKATYTKNRAAVKASVRYFAHRIDRDGNRITRAIFGQYGLISKDQAYRMIDRTKGQAYFYRIVLSPKNTGEPRDLPQITRQTMRQLQRILRSNSPIPFLAVAHTDHSDTPHVHALAVLRTYLSEDKLARLREACERVVVTGYPEPSVQTERGYSNQRPSTGTGGGTRTGSIAQAFRWQPHFLPSKHDIFIARAGIRALETHSGGGDRGGGGEAPSGRKVFVCRLQSDLVTQKDRQLFRVQALRYGNREESKPACLCQ